MKDSGEELLEDRAEVTEQGELWEGGARYLQRAVSTSSIRVISVDADMPLIKQKAAESGEVIFMGCSSPMKLWRRQYEMSSDGVDLAQTGLDE